MSYSLSQSNSHNRINYDSNLEGLRGLVALAVGLAHVFGIKNILDPTYTPNSYGLNVGHGCVLMFFVISGYVIGLTNQGEYSEDKAKKYLIRRTVRIIPIYIISILLGVLIRPEDFLTVFGNLFFLQNILVSPLKGNGSLWSLNYEILYYLIFLVIWLFRPKIKFILIFCLCISVFGCLTSLFPQGIYSYVSGFIFWLFGLWLSFQNKNNHKLYNKIPLISYLFLFYAIENFEFGKIIIHGLGFTDSSMLGITFSDIISTLPICVLIISIVTKRHFYGFGMINILCFLLPILMILFLLNTHRILEIRWIPAIVFYCLSLVLLGIKININKLASFEIFGEISYGFYLTHFPLLLIIHDYFPYSGTLESFSLRLLVWLLLSIAASAILEILIQPKIKSWCYQKLLVNNYT